MKECAEEARALVLSFHSFEALNSDFRVSVNTCHGDLSPCGGGGGGGCFFFSWPLDFSPPDSPVPSCSVCDESEDWEFCAFPVDSLPVAPLEPSSLGGSRISSLGCCCWKRAVAEVNGLDVAEVDGSNER